MDRTILHCDCNAFYASVECVLNPELKKVPMAVGGDEESRHGIILAKNELAKKYNIQTAETIWQAKKKCPDLDRTMICITSIQSRLWIFINGTPIMSSRSDLTRLGWMLREVKDCSVTV